MRGTVPAAPGWFIWGLIVVEILHIRQFISLLAWLHDHVIGGAVRAVALLWNLAQKEGR